LKQFINIYACALFLCFYLCYSVIHATTLTFAGHVASAKPAMTMSVPRAFAVGDEQGFLRGAAASVFASGGISRGLRLSQAHAGAPCPSGRELAYRLHQLQLPQCQRGGSGRFGHERHAAQRWMPEPGLQRERLPGGLALPELGWSELMLHTDNQRASPIVRAFQQELVRALAGAG
jgi:hypothetical protein